MAFLNGFERRPSWIHEEIDEYFYLHEIDAYDFISYDINIYWKASSIIAIMYLVCSRAFVKHLDFHLFTIMLSIFL